MSFQSHLSVVSENSIDNPCHTSPHSPHTAYHLSPNLNVDIPLAPFVDLEVFSEIQLLDDQASGARNQFSRRVVQEFFQQANSTLKELEVAQ
jgi:hypothetical protein